MASWSKQRVITIVGVVAAVAALAMGAQFQADQRTPEPNVVGGAGTTQVVAPGITAATTTPVDPVEGFLPKGGAGSACSEPVGVTLAPGYAATLTINGVQIPPDQMNVKLDANGQPTKEITASRSLGQYTFGPEPNCPQGKVLRPTQNVLRACVYRIESGPTTCVVAEHTFDAI